MRTWDAAKICPFLSFPPSSLLLAFSVSLSGCTLPVLLNYSLSLAFSSPSSFHAILFKRVINWLVSTLNLLSRHVFCIIKGGCEESRYALGWALVYERSVCHLFDLQEAYFQYCLQIRL